jgi:localization factor PodJL
MARTPQWNVKGIDDAARIIARDAAAKAGLPIGSWIGRAVLRAAREERRAIPPSTIPHAVDELVVNALPDAPPAPANSDTPLVGAAPERVEIGLPPPSHSGGSASVFGRWPRVLAAGAVVVVLVAAGVWLLGEAPPSGKSTTSAPPQAAATPSNSTPAQSAPATTTTPPVPAIETLRQAAASGDARAQYELGVRYASGRDIAKDDAEAARWFEEAAIQGHASAQYNLGVMYGRGIGLKQDDTLAFFWYQSAADQGHPRAQHNLATAYADGKGTSQDFAAAARWFEKAANAGIAESQYYLGAIYERGLSGPTDRAQAMALYAQAARQGQKEAAERLAALEAEGARAASTPVPQPEEFTPAAMPARSTPTSGAPLARGSIAEIQRLLARLDFDPGPADGVIGRKTNQAIAAYQRMAGMPVDGVPSALLLEELREVAGAAKR